MGLASVSGPETSCDLPGAIKKLADKLDPPKPEEREWRTGDVVSAIGDATTLAEGVPYFVTNVASEPKGVTLHVGKDKNFSIGRKHYRNLTILAEMEVEK